jgi:WD40 repeat protein
LPQGFSACWSPDGRWLYHVRPDASSWHIEKIPAAELLVRIPGSRLPLLFRLCTLSPDGKWLALPLLDGATANVWLIPTSGEPTIPVTDFAGRPTAITRQVSWSPDSREIFAAVAEQHVDVIALDGLL